MRNEHSKWLRYNNPASGSAYFCNEDLGVCSLTPPEEGILGDASPTFSDFAARFSTESLQSGGQGCCDRTLARLRDFFSAFFEESAFKWFYVVAVIGTISGQFMGEHLSAFVTQIPLDFWGFYITKSPLN